MCDRIITSLSILQRSCFVLLLLRHIAYFLRNLNQFVALKCIILRKIHIGKMNGQLLRNFSSAKQLDIIRKKKSYYYYYSKILTRVDFFHNHYQMLSQHTFILFCIPQTFREFYIMCLCDEENMSVTYGINHQ